ncbi:Fucose permease [Rubellimicrobium thermophilum DSM 16684]|uniref:Fucose permease n=1 Tax=Rubellimicrobium thermophilum DSM 16684 TaxID=1123069 RepID=S9R5L3_9RHOB|nr:MFS transporter [Rubellimicrobium thermophilum]EPX87192.1 Fucose permease [Rubellimicrobium thermophilum DSM 16684]
MSVLSALRLSARPSAAFAALGGFWGCFAAYVPVIKDGLNVSDGTFGLLLLGSATGLVSAMWIAPAVDRRLGGRAMQVLACAFAAVWLLPGLMGAPLLFFAALYAVGLCSGLLDVTMNARVSELEAVHRRSLMNAAHGMFSVGYTLGAVWAGLAREAGLSPTMALACVGALVVLLLVPRMYQEPVRAEVPPAGRGAWPLVPVLLCGGVVLSAFMTEAATESWSALHIERTLGGRAAEGALGPAMLGITMALGRFGGQAVAERLREVQVIVAAAVLAGAGLLVAALAVAPWMAQAGFGLFGLGVSVIGPMGLALVGQMVAPHWRTEAISRAAVMGFSGFFFAPVLMGLISEAAGLRAAFAAMALLVAMAAPLALVLARRPMPGGLGCGLGMPPLPRRDEAIRSRRADASEPPGCRRSCRGHDARSGRVRASRS